MGYSPKRPAWSPRSPHSPSQDLCTPFRMPLFRFHLRASEARQKCSFRLTENKKTLFAEQSENTHIFVVKGLGLMEMRGGRLPRHLSPRLVPLRTLEAGRQRTLTETGIARSGTSEEIPREINCIDVVPFHLPKEGRAQQQIGKRKPTSLAAIQALVAAAFLEQANLQGKGRGVRVARCRSSSSPKYGIA